MTKPTIHDDGVGPVSATEAEGGHHLALWRRFNSPAFKVVGRPRLLGWDPSGAVLHLTLAHADVPRVESWDVRTGERLPSTVLVRGAPVAGLAIDAAYSRFTLGSYDFVVEEWDLRTGTLLDVSTREREGRHYATSADGRLLVQCHSRTRDRAPFVSVYSLSARRGVGERPGHFPVAMSPDGSLFVAGTASHDPGGYTLDVSRPDGTLVATLISSGGATAAMFSRDGRRVVAGFGDGGVACWEVAAGELVWRVRPLSDDTWRLIGALARAADGDGFFAAAFNGFLYAISAAGEIRWRAALLPDGMRPHERLQLLPSPDGASLAVGIDEQSPRIVDAATGVDRTPVQGHRGHLVALVVSADGRLAASSDDRGEVRVYDLARDETLWALEVEGGVSGMAFSPDGRSLWTAGPDGSVRRWSLATGSEESRRPVWPHAPAHGVVAARDGARLLVACGERLELWSDQRATPAQWSQRIKPAVRFEAAFCDAEARVAVATFGAGRWSLASLDASDGRPIGVPEEMRGSLRGLRPTDDGPLSFTVVDGRLVVREAFGARRELAVREASVAVWATDVSADGRWMVLADRNNVEVWSLAAPARCVGRVRPAGELDAVAQVALSADGGLVVVGTVGGVVAVYQWTEGAASAPPGATRRASV